MEARLKAYLVESEVYSSIMCHDVDDSTTIDAYPIRVSVKFGFVTNLEWLTAKDQSRALLLGPISSAPALGRVHASQRSLSG